MLLYIDTGTKKKDIIIFLNCDFWLIYCIFNSHFTEKFNCKMAALQKLSRDGNE